MSMFIKALSLVILVILVVLFEPQATIFSKTSGGKSQVIAIMGQVTDEQYNPLSGYVVEAISMIDEVTYLVKTNQSGKYELSNLYEGVWTLSVKFYSTTLKQRKIMLSKGMALEVNFAVEATGSVSGFLLDSASRTPLPIDGDIYLGLLTEWETMDRTFRGHASSGTFEVKNLLPGQYIVIDSFFGYVFDMSEVPKVTVYPEGNVNGIELLLKRGALIHGRLVDEKAQPISGVEVKVASNKIHSLRPSMDFSHSARTGDDGKFWLTTPSDPNEYYSFRIVIIDPRYQGQLIRRDLERGRREYHLRDIVMQKKLIMTGRVSDPTGGFVRQLKVMLKMHNKPVSFFRFVARTEIEVSTDSKGNFVFEELYPTEYSLAVSRDGITTAFLGSVNPQKQRHVKIRLKKTKMLRGRVVNSQHKPLAEAYISATMLPRLPELNGIHLSTSRTNVDGKFQLQVMEMDPPLLMIEVAKRGFLSRFYQNVRITQEKLVVVLEKGIPIKGHVFMPPGVPLDGSYAVKLFPANLQIDPVINPFLLRNPLVSKRFRGSEPQFKIDGLLKGKYALYIAGDGIAATGLEVDVTSNEQKSQEITVLVNRPSVVLKGRVLWADTGEPVVKALVYRSWYPWDLEPYDSPMRLDRFETETDENGSFEFTNLTQGRYLLEIRYADVSFENNSSNRNTIHKQIEIPACCNQPYIFYLGRRDGISFVNESMLQSKLQQNFRN